MKGLNIRDLTQWMIPRMTMAGCYISDIESTLKQIVSQDSWPEEWAKTAQKYLDIARTAESQGHLLTAYQMYFYAMIYFYEGQKILFEETERKRKLFGNMMDLYQKVIQLCPYPVEKVEIPFENLGLPGYLHKPHGPGPFPCLVFIQGVDSSKEEWHVWGQRAVERGFALLTVDTPGHGETRIMHHLHLEIPRVIRAATACREYLAGRADIIPEKIGLLGNCLGSNYAFQTAGVDHAFSCCLIILCIAEFKVRTSEADVPKWFVDMIRFFTGDTTGNSGAFDRFRDDFCLDKHARRVICPTHLCHPEQDNWLAWEQTEVMAQYVDGPLTITKVAGEPAFEGNAMSHLVPIYEQIHWVLPVAFDWVADQYRL